MYLRRFFCINHLKIWYTFFEVVFLSEKNRKDTTNKDNTTEYGEFISSYFAWMSLDKQKEEADKLSNITEDKNE